MATDNKCPWCGAKPKCSNTQIGAPTYQCGTIGYTGGPEYGKDCLYNQLVDMTLERDSWRATAYAVRGNTKEIDLIREFKEFRDGDRFKRQNNDD